MRFFNLKNLAAFLCCTLAFFAFTSLSVCHAQDVSGMTGMVTDQSGAAIPGATVVLSNAATGAIYKQTTNSIGSYRFAQIPPGVGYSAHITAKGFAPVTISSISLLVNQVRTQNASMNVGTQISTVEVTANGAVTIDTTDALVGNDLDPQQLNNLPVQQRNDPLALFAMQPGVTDTGSVTGARVDQNDVTLDGLDVNDFATGGASQGNAGSGITTQLGTIVGHAPIDSVEEFQGNVAGNQAATGPAAGGQFALVTKSGTNQFHGDLNEYHRDTSLTANSWFSNDANPIVPRQHLIHNQFGGSAGGPILRNRAFFFFDFNDSRVVAGSVVTRTVPSPSLRQGSIRYCTASPCANNNKTLTMAEVNAFDPAGIGVDQNWLNFINKRFPSPNQTGGGDGLNSLGYIFNAPNNDNETNYVSRIDYRINPSMNLWGRFTITREDAVYAPNEFPGDPVTSPFTDRSYAFVIGHDWVMGSNKTNRLFLGETVQKVGYPINYNPTGTTAFTFGDGADNSMSSNPYIWPDSQARRVPNEQLGDNFSLVKGRHTWQFGGVLKDILAHDTTAADFNISEIGLGGHVFS
ncbi:MAG: carboxypeptidase regulatory-like domain-containing protein, partial [Terriglobia bacterium]